MGNLVAACDKAMSLNMMPMRSFSAALSVTAETMARCSARLAHLLLLATEPALASPLPIRKGTAGSAPGRLPLFGDAPAGPLATVHPNGYRRGASPACPVPSAARTGGAGRPRRSRYVCEMWRPIFPSPGGLPSGIINPCATAADRRAGAGTLRTGYRGWSDGISAPSGTDALNHTNSKYERMCTEV